MKTPKTLFLAWQDPISRFWFTIGRLIFDGGIYQFVYTQGVKEGATGRGGDVNIQAGNLFVKDGGELE